MRIFAALLLPQVALVAGAAVAANTKADVPSICKPPNKLDAANEYWYVDETESCKGSNGHCEEACGTFIKSGGVCTPSGPVSEKDSDDLGNALALQVVKDGQFETTTVGSWTASFPLGITAIHAPTPFLWWDRSWDTFVAENDYTPHTVYFQASGDGYYDAITITYNC